MDIKVSNNIIIIYCADGKLSLNHNVGTENILKDEMFKGKLCGSGTPKLVGRHNTVNIKEYMCLDQTKSQVLELRNPLF